MTFDYLRNICCLAGAVLWELHFYYTLHRVQILGGMDDTLGAEECRYSQSTRNEQGQA